jgi:hypothetical protein
MKVAKQQISFPGIERNSRIMRYFFTLAGIFIWLPGIGLNVGGQYLQPFEILLLVWMVVEGIRFLLRGKIKLTYFVRFMVPMFSISWIISAVFSENISESIIYLLYYFGLILPGMFLLYNIAISESRFIFFIQGFLVGGIVSSIVGVCQFLLGPQYFNFINNKNFSLIPVKKAFGFTPEASILAGLLVIAIAVVLFLLKRKDCRNYFRKFHNKSLIVSQNKLLLLLMILVTGFIATLSSSVIVVLPIVIMYLYVKMYNVEKLLKTIFTEGLVFVVIILVFYFGFWENRWETGDASGSMVMRAASMIAALETFFQNWLIGVGLGNTSEAVTETTTGWIDKIMPGLPVKSGVDSFPLHLMVEQGIVAFLLIVYSVRWGWKGINRKMMRINPMLPLLSVILFSSFIVGLLTVGYRGLYHLWLIFPFSVAIHSLFKETAKSSTRNDTR